MSDQTVIHPGEQLELVLNRKCDIPDTPKYIMRPQGTAVRPSILTNNNVEDCSLIKDVPSRI